MATSQYFEYRPLDEKVDAAPLTLGLGYAGFQSVHDRTNLRAYDLIQHTGLLYLQKDGELGGMPAQARVTGSFEYTDLGGDSSAGTSMER